MNIELTFILSFNKSKIENQFSKLDSKLLLLIRFSNCRNIVQSGKCPCIYKKISKYIRVSYQKFTSKH